jgi:hypothetical protein
MRRKVASEPIRREQPLQEKEEQLIVGKSDPAPTNPSQSPAQDTAAPTNPSQSPPDETAAAPTNHSQSPADETAAVPEKSVNGDHSNEEEEGEEEEQQDTSSKDIHHSNT